MPGTVAAQDIEEFVISGEAAKNAKTRDEISLDTARRIADQCFQQATERNLATSIFVLNPSGHIVYALRADGQTPIAESSDWPSVTVNGSRKLPFVRKHRVALEEK